MSISWTAIFIIMELCGFLPARANLLVEHGSKQVDRDTGFPEGCAYLAIYRGDKGVMRRGQRASGTAAFPL